MRYIKLGKTGIEVSVIGFGAWAIGGRQWGGTDEGRSIKAIHAAVDSGITLIDTAPAYGKGLSEEIIGKAIKGIRGSLIIATKCGLRWKDSGDRLFFRDEADDVYRCLGTDSIRYEVEQSLKRLDTDYIDLYQTHWPDTEIPIEETMETLMELKQEGKIRAIGACNVDIKQLEEYKKAGQLVTDQEKYNLIDNEIEDTNIPWCMRNGVTLLAYSPMAQGLLTGKITPERKFKGDDIRIGDPRFSIENRRLAGSVLKRDLKPVAEKYGLTLTQLSIASIISRDNVIALCGIRNARQAVENSGAGDTIIDDVDLVSIRRVIQGMDL